DLSMKSWVEELEYTFSETVSIQLNQPAANATMFQDKVSKMISFYSTEGYKPFRLDGFGEEVVLQNATITVLGASLVGGPVPARISSIFRVSVDQCMVLRSGCQAGALASMFFDFKGPVQVESAQDMALMLFVIGLMLVVSLILSHALDRLLVQPMDRMLNMVKSMAADLLKQFGLDDNLEEEGDETIAETALIEEIFKKFARLANLAAVRNELTEEHLGQETFHSPPAVPGMDTDARAVLVDVMHLQVHSSMASVAAVANMSEPSYANLPVSERTVFSSFDLDVLELTVDQNKQVVVHMFFDSLIGRVTGRMLAHPETFHKFHSVVQSNYNSLPYHNYFHAVDVTYTVHRLMDINQTDAWLSNVEQYALLLAALCHDVGHQGKTNPFLVETQHQLARIYNDKSPLEMLDCQRNMHAAKLFEIAANEAQQMFGHGNIVVRMLTYAWTLFLWRKEADVFKRLDKDARKTAEHFEMVRLE
ncbi:dnc, partial [Symbiodinium pilosum]